jgi:hypothetical protein
MKWMNFFFNLPNPSGRTWPLTEMSTRSRKIMLVGSRARPVRKADSYQWANCLDNVGSSTSHNLISVHSLIREIALLFKKIFLILEDPRVEAGKNTSTVIPASRKRRGKENRISLRWDSASRPKRWLMRIYFWIILFTSYKITAN